MKYWIKTKEKTLFFILFFVIKTAYTQVGIGTTNPQKDLHIAGPTSTVRIDGLNSANNANNAYTRNQPIYLDANGDFVIPASPAEGEILIDTPNAITDGSPVTLQTGTNGETNSVQLYQTAAFTLTQPTIVMINYSVSIDVFDFAGTSPVTDGKPKIIKNYFYLGDGTNIITTPAYLDYGYCGNTYMNSVATGYIATGPIINSSFATVLLGAGTHSIHVYGEVFAADGVTSPTSADSFSAKFGKSDDLLTVIALY